MTEYKLDHFTMADAHALAGKTADITEWDDGELETKVTYPGAEITGIIVPSGPYLVIETAGAVITGARTGERLGTRPPELHLFFTWVCEVANVRGRFERGARVALEDTGDPATRPLDQAAEAFPGRCPRRSSGWRPPGWPAAWHPTLRTRPGTRTRTAPSRKPRRRRGRRGLAAGHLRPRHRAEQNAVGAVRDLHPAAR